MERRHAHRAFRLAFAMAALAPSGALAQSPMDFNPLPMCRMWDTRNPPGPAGGPKLAANTVRCFPATGFCGLPVGAGAVVFNATAMSGTDSGTLRFFAAGQVPTPSSPSLSFKAGGTASASGLIVPMMGASAICVRVEMSPGSTGLVHSLTDSVGYYDRFARTNAGP
jgi:hypothetical protein